MTSNKDRKVFDLSDQFIGQVAKAVQLSMLTGTNVVDWFRMFRVEESSKVPGALVMTPEYLEHFDRNIEEMLSRVDSLGADEPDAQNSEAV